LLAFGKFHTRNKSAKMPIFGFFKPALVGRKFLQLFGWILRRRGFMKNLCKILGIIALIAVIGFSMAACDIDDDGDGGNSGQNTGGNNTGGNNTGGSETGVPSVPTGVSATAQSSSSISVSWSSVSGATSYDVYYEIGNSTLRIRHTELHIPIPGCRQA
jgi:hypothetical protein